MKINAVVALSTAAPEHNHDLSRQVAIFKSFDEAKSIQVLLVCYDDFFLLLPLGPLNIVF